MEPFGLLRLLNDLLPKPPEKTEEKEPKEPAPPPQSTEKAEKPNACLAFFEAHEQRANRKK